MGIAIADHRIPSISADSIRRFAVAVGFTNHSHAVLALPAGPNRTNHLGPTAELARALNEEFPRACIDVRMAIDDVELDRAQLAIEQADRYPAIQELAAKLPQVDRIAILPAVQSVSNSVLEVYEAMREAAEKSDISHFIAPRNGFCLFRRVAIGASHYAKKLHATTLRSASILLVPGESRSLGARAGHAALEAASLATTLLARLGGADHFEEFIERRGAVGRILNTAQQLKIGLLARLQGGKSNS